MLGFQPYFDIDKTSTVQLSATRAVRNLPPRKSPGTHLCYRLSGPQGYRMRPEGIGHLKSSKDPNWNRTGTSRLVAHYFNQLPRSPSLLQDACLCISEPKGWLARGTTCHIILD
jgi:hypothetical protein